MADPGTGWHRQAPAKVNLGLRVERRDPDALYHPLDSVMVTLALADELVVRPAARAGFRLRVEGEPVPGPNLVERAWRWYRERGGEEAALYVVLHKHIPVAAGLGGGSSDAAALLRGLACGRPGAPWLDRTAAGTALGMDVPFFLSGEPAARVSGYGEQVAPLPRPPARWGVLLARPRLAVSTARVFQAYDEAGLGPSAAVGAVATALEAGRLPDSLPNDLEPALWAAYPETRAFAGALNRVLAAAGTPYVLGLSGSGPTYVALLPEAGPGSPPARALAEQLTAVVPWFRITGFAA